MRGIGMPYGPRWRNWRAVSEHTFIFGHWAPHWKLFLKLIHAGLSMDASQFYKPLQSSESKVLLNDLLGAKDSEEYGQHLRRWVFENFRRVRASYAHLWLGILFLLFQASRIVGEFGIWIKKLWKKTKRLSIVSASMFVFITKYIVLCHRYNKVSTELLHCRFDFSWPWVNCW